MTSLLGFNEAVNLSVGSLPVGVTASFFPAAVTPSGTSILVLTASSDAATGSFPLIIAGTGGGINHTTSGDIALNFGLVPICYGSFSGTVTDRGTGLPVAGVQVEASNMNTMTNESGSYTLKNVPLGQYNAPATYTLSAAPQPNLAFWTGSASGTAICGVTTTVDLQVLRIRNGTVSGVVQGRDFATGQIIPLAGAPISLSVNLEGLDWSKLDGLPWYRGVRLLQEKTALTAQARCQSIAIMLRPATSRNLQQLATGRLGNPYGFRLTRIPSATRPCGHSVPAASLG